MHERNGRDTQRLWRHIAKESMKELNCAQGGLSRYSEVTYKEDATEGIYRAWGPLIIRLPRADFLNICKDVADKMAVLLILISGFLHFFLVLMCLALLKSDI